MRKSTNTDEIDFTGPSWLDLCQIKGRKSLFAEFLDSSGAKHYYRIVTLGGVRGSEPFHVTCVSQRGSNEVAMLGMCLDGHDKPAEYKVIRKGHKR